MTRMYDHMDDFETEIFVLSKADGGRATAPFNGIRWDFLYEGEEPTESLYMIWPEFIDESGDAIPKDIPLAGTLTARMYIVNRKLAESVHRARIKIGTRFYSMEGPKKVAKGVVTRITGLAVDLTGS